MARNYLLMDTVVSHSKKWRQRAMAREKKNLLVIVFTETVSVENVNAPLDGVDQNVTKVKS